MKSFTNFRSYFAERMADVIRTRENMHAYQSGEALPFLKKNPFSALFVDLGLGKSVISATLMADLFEEGDWNTWLVIAPKRVARQTWPNEFREWQHLAWMTYGSPFDKQYKKELSDAARKAVRFAQAVAELDEPSYNLPEEQAAYDAYWLDAKQNIRNAAIEAREKQSQTSIVEAFKRNRACVHIINREVFEHLVRAWGPNRWPYRKIVVDESQSFKSYKSARFKAMKAIRPRLRRLHLLTATPAAESYLDLFAPMWLLDEGERLGKGITRFRERYFQRGYDGWTWKLLPGSEELIADKIRDICLTLRAEDYLDLAKPKYIDVAVKLDKAHLKKYHEFQKSFVYALPDGENIVADTAAALSQKLCQLASGTLYDKDKKAHHIHDAKIETLREIEEEANGSPLLVAYWFKSSLDRLTKAFPHAVVMDADGKCVKAWNQGKIKMMLIHPASGGAGLNLQHGGHLLAMYDIFHSNELYQQLVGRLARQGQKQIVRIFHLLAQGTVDPMVLASAQGKQDAQERLFKYMRNIVRKVLRAERIETIEDDEEIYSEAL